MIRISAHLPQDGCALRVDAHEVAPLLVALVQLHRHLLQLGQVYLEQLLRAQLRVIIEIDLCWPRRTCASSSAPSALVGLSQSRALLCDSRLRRWVTNS